MSNDNIKGFDLQKNKALFPKIQKEAVKEALESVPDSFIHFSNDDISNYCLDQVKSRIKADVSPRVLNNWIREGVIEIEESDKGKIKRFNRIENIWLDIVVDLRKFGVPLKALKEIRKQLFSYEVSSFCLFKFKVLHNILSNPEYLVIDENHTVGFYPYKTYSKLAEKGALLSHINIRFIDYVKSEFLNNNISANFNIKNIDGDVEKVALLYFLKTNSFNQIKIELSMGDVRLINDSSSLKNNTELINSIENWNFKSIVVEVNNETEFIIKN